MKRLLPLLLLLLASPSMLAQPPEPIPPGHDLIPVLPYLFFDSASAAIPDRYVQFRSAIETARFSDTTIDGDALAHHRQLLNIIGYRMKRFPKTRVEIQPHGSDPYIGETEKNLIVQRGEVVRDYLVKIWGIDPSRLVLLEPREVPRQPSNRKDPRGVVENRRTEIVSTDWEIMRPVWRHRVMSAGVTTGTLDVYLLVLFRFDSPEGGPLNDRILKEYIYPNVSPTARITVDGFIDNADDYERRGRLTGQRTAWIVSAIRRNVIGLAKEALTGRSVGDALFPVDLPEGRFFSRSVRVTVER